MKLKQWLKKYDISVKQMENDLMYGKNYLYKVIGGKILPGKKLATIISEYTEGEVTLKDLGYVERVRCPCPHCGKLM